MTLFDNFLHWAHVIGACVLLGTGAGIAFFMVMAHQTRDAAFIAKTAAIVVLADYVFTLSAVIAQPITGALMIMRWGYSFGDFWVVASLSLYVLTGAFWVPVVFMQARMRDLAREAADKGEVLPPAYFKLYRTWFAFGFPAFFAVLAILWLMLTRPV